MNMWVCVESDTCCFINIFRSLSMPTARSGIQSRIYHSGCSHQQTFTETNLPSTKKHQKDPTFKNIQPTKVHQNMKPLRKSHHSSTKLFMKSFRMMEIPNEIRWTQNSASGTGTKGFTARVVVVLLLKLQGKHGGSGVRPTCQKVQKTWKMLPIFVFWVICLGEDFDGFCFWSFWGLILGLFGGILILGFFGDDFQDPCSNIHLHTLSDPNLLEML